MYIYIYIHGDPGENINVKHILAKFWRIWLEIMISSEKIIDFLQTMGKSWEYQNPYLLQDNHKLGNSRYVCWFSFTHPASSL